MIFVFNMKDSNFWIEFIKVAIPPAIAGIIALIPYFKEVKITKEKIMFERNSADVKLLKASLQQYVSKVNGYRYSTEKMDEEAIFKMVDDINFSRINFINNIDNCIGLFTDEEINELEKFKRKILISDVKVRNNLFKNEINGKYNDSKFLYENKEDSFDKDMKEYKKILKMISLKSRNL